MAQKISLKAEARKLTGRNRIKAIRKEGLVPAIIYSKGKAEQIQVNSKELDKVLHATASENLMLDLDLEGKKRSAFLKDVQHHTITNRVLHVDFHEISDDEKLSVNVPVTSEGEAIGVKTHGGILMTVMQHLHIECFPKDLPEVIHVDVSSIQVGESIHVGEIPLKEGITPLDHKDQPVFSVVAAAVSDVKKDGEVEEGDKEPEVIKSKPVEDEDGK